jgi:hypothetical protein
MGHFFFDPIVAPNGSSWPASTDYPQKKSPKAKTYPYPRSNFGEQMRGRNCGNNYPMAEILYLKNKPRAVTEPV